MLATIFSVTAWTTITFFGASVKSAKEKGTNETIEVEIPRLLIKSWYPWYSDTMSGTPYLISFVIQFIYLLFSLCQSNLADVLFCSWLLFACEQLQHLKVFFFFHYFIQIFINKK